LNAQAELDGGKMRKSRLSAIASGIAVIGAAVTLVLTTVPAQAASSIPGSSQTCSPGQPKLDYEWFLYNSSGNYTYTWSNVCGTGTWQWTVYTGAGALYALRMPTSPYHRIWLHQNPDGSGLSACFYSTNDDIYIAGYELQYGDWIGNPGNVQVSSNTSSC
jgi:hypothetical protein